ncbi:MAG TPA: hypothetical protein VHQ39_05425, partial [Dongiaceae bacterium]|nr:hypothetical protein [Dongiaceae bacterium]
MVQSLTSTASGAIASGADTSSGDAPCNRPAGVPLRVALAGLGTVGAGVIRLIETNGALIARRAGRPIVISVVSARDRHKDRGIDLAAYGWEDDMTGIAARDDVDVVVELVG